MTSAVLPAGVAGPAIQAILERFRKGSPVTAKDRATLARALLAAGAPLKSVLAACNIRQQAVVQASGLAQSRVSRILSKPTVTWQDQGARREGREATLRVYRTAAKLLNISLHDIPEAKQLLKASQ